MIFRMCSLGLYSLAIALVIASATGHGVHLERHHSDDRHPHHMEHHNHNHDGSKPHVILNPHHPEHHRHSNPNNRKSIQVRMKMEVDTVDHSKLNVWLYALLSTTMIGLAPIAIIYFIPFNIGPQAGRKSQYTLRVLLAFAVGGLLGDVFLHLLPHAAHADEHHHDHDSLQDEHHHSHGSSGFWVLVGIMTFLIIEKTILCIGGSDHGHSHAKKEEKVEESSDKDSEQLPQSSLRRRNKQSKDNHTSADQSSQHKIEEPKPSHSLAVSAYLNLAADFTHNFTDGLAVGASFLADSRIGFVTVVAILLHEIPHEIGDYAILVQAGVSRKRAIALQVWTAIGALIGTVIGLLTEGTMAGAAWILPSTAGGFLYIAMSSVIPELLKKSSPMQSVKEIAAILTGIGLMATISLFE